MHTEQIKWLLDTYDRAHASLRKVTAERGNILGLTVQVNAIRKQLLDLGGWKEAVIDACVVSGIGWDESNPRQSLQSLIAWENQLALDPAVSGRAQGLVEQGHAQASARLGAVPAETVWLINAAAEGQPALWQQAAAEYIGQPDVIPFVPAASSTPAPPAAQPAGPVATGLLRKLAEANEKMLAILMDQASKHLAAPHPSQPAEPVVRLLDTGAPRGERNWHFVEVNGREVFGSFKRPQAQEVLDLLRAALAVPVSNPEGECQSCAPKGHCTAGSECVATSNPPGSAALEAEA